MSITARTRVLTLFGDPVEHSASPEIQNAAFLEAGVDGVYVAVRCATEDLAGFMRGLALAGGGGNITLPHKEKAAAIVDVSSEAVRRTGACNTFWGENGQVHGDNTDVEGFRRALQIFMDGPSKGARALVLGAGGAARATLVGLLEEGADEVLLYNRTSERAQAVARRIGGQRARVVPVMEELDGERFDIVINTTRVGLDPDDPAPIDFELLGRAGAVMDLVYGRHQTSFVKAAERLGIRATDGMEMLVQQGAASFESWWNKPAPIDLMRNVIRQSLDR
ncbi:MAG: shikimate dehydrogenase [Gemmatimonadetes bacterium]|nr:shikimate dehydrogenase [Gemmatimonadota bacterium]